VVLLAFFALYFFIKGKNLQKRLSEEIRDVPSASASGGTTSMTYRRVQEEKFPQ
jgi:hypothetical protein